MSRCKRYAIECKSGCTTVCHAENSYVPSNGTEGMAFIEEFCDNCIHEKWSHTHNDDDKKCDILSRSMLCSVTEKDYPREWQYVAGRPTCTAFVKWDWGNDGDPDDPDNPKSPSPPTPINQLDIFPLYPNEKHYDTETKTNTSIESSDTSRSLQK